MTRALTILLLATLLSGCSTVGNALKKTGQVLMDPSIQVGSADDQPTQVALSLYASPDVNPNAQSDPPAAASASVAPLPLDIGKRNGPFAVNFSSRSRAELIASLRELLGHFEKNPPEGAPLPTVAAEPPRGTLRSPLPPPGYQPDEADLDTPLPLAAANTTDRAGGLAPGQYRAEHALADDAPPPASASKAAMPIAFRIIQLRDDSLLLNATFDQIQQDIKKALGSTFLRADDYVLLPGQFKFLSFRPLHEEANYLAIVADFGSTNDAVWKDVYRLEPRGRKYALLVSMQGNHVSIIDESRRPAPSSSPRSKH
ncbi:type VI secretion system lipoprotein TssJ [Cupriavidus basilensis]|uniref:Type VI secretion system lipoprotein TssJ n=1 Tax=Cupriavidus basilensis TaxID=68895 RepID=A0ABT6AFU8_9BURK|nr:type VI secretion system lipoprotein TssJ [Cupriavidus basilensis]MDF3831470.1 type VI secretion system lipoprotein TssJ [Cupriavidus basilensis]